MNKPVQVPGEIAPNNPMHPVTPAARAAAVHAMRAARAKLPAPILVPTIASTPAPRPNANG